NGVWNYALNNADTNTNALAQGEPAADVFTYTVSDGHGGSATATLTVNLTGTNDQPVITGGATTGAVKEDVANQNQATGQLTAFDPDHGATQAWTVVGGTPSGSADYHFRMDSLNITKNGGPFFTDNFSDGIAPPIGPNGTSTSYGLFG